MVVAELEVRNLGRLGYSDALEVQHQLVAQRKQGLIPDQLLFVEHPHVITMGRNGHIENLLVSEERLRQEGIEFHHTNRGGDVTYHGPGQLVGYPIFDLREWKRDVMAYVRTLESVLSATIGTFGLHGELTQGQTGVWVNGAKVAAIGVHITRWVAYHGFALNVTTNMDYFRYIVPCGLTRPVTSTAALGCSASAEEIQKVLIQEFSKQFERNIVSNLFQPGGRPRRGYELDTYPAHI